MGQTARVLASLALLLLASGAEARIYECSQDKDCPAVGKCESGICQCQLGMDLSEDGSACLRLARGYGDQCEEVAQCGTLKGATVCEGTCRCAEGWVYLMGECVRKKDFGEACSEDAECFDGAYYNARICKDRKCDCNQWYYKRGNEDCRHNSAKFNNLCVLDQDCQFDSKQDSVCVAGRCTGKGERLPSAIPTGVLHREDSEVHPRTIGDSCRSNDECPIPNSHCSSIFAECMCDKSYYFKSGVCIQELGGPCVDNGDCEIRNSECVENVCVCKSEDFLYVQTHGNQRCSKPATGDKFSCSSDDSCKVFLRNYECTDDIERTCRCTGLNVPSDDSICKPGNCQQDSDCQSVMPNSVCAPNQVCACPGDYSFHDNKCYGPLGSTCKYNDDCMMTEHSVCTDKSVCGCGEGYVGHVGACYPVPGRWNDSCVVDAQCSVTDWQSVCVDGKCGCAPGHKEIGKHCLRMAKAIGERCTKPEMCLDLIGSVCRNGACQCEVNKISLDGKSCVNGAVGLKLTPVALLVTALFIFHST